MDVRIIVVICVVVFFVAMFVVAYLSDREDF